MSSLEQWLATARQWSYPREFRIAPVSVAPEVLAAVARVLAAAPPDQVPAPGNDGGVNRRLMADLCTALWRAQRNLVGSDGQTPRTGMELAGHHVLGALATLEQSGFEIRDHTGEPWTDGRAIDVVVFEPTPGISRETIIETLRPSVLHDGSLMQEGQVIVGTPVDGGSPASSPGTVSGAIDPNPGSPSRTA